MQPEIQRARDRAIRGAKLGVHFVANDVHARAVPLTPLGPNRSGKGGGEIPGGGLRASLQTDVVEDDDREFVMEVSANTPYAGAQHAGGWVTGPLAGVRIKNYTTPGTGPHFLEVPFKAHLARYRETIGRSVRASLRGSGARVT